MPIIVIVHVFSSFISSFNSLCLSLLQSPKKSISLYSQLSICRSRMVSQSFLLIGLPRLEYEIDIIFIYQCILPFVSCHHHNSHKIPKKTITMSPDDSSFFIMLADLAVAFSFLWLLVYPFENESIPTFHLLYFFRSFLSLCILINVFSCYLMYARAHWAMMAKKSNMIYNSR